MRLNLTINAQPGEAIIVAAGQQAVLKRILSRSIVIPQIEVAASYDNRILPDCCPTRYDGGKGRLSLRNNRSFFNGKDAVQICVRSLTSLASRMGRATKVPP